MACYVEILAILAVLAFGVSMSIQVTELQMLMRGCWGQPVFYPCFLGNIDLLGKRGVDKRVTADNECKVQRHYIRIYW